jgi:dTDP-4-dehydrorhamnose 3,5-epimerase
MRRRRADALIFKPQCIPDVILCEPQVRGDSRGYFLETFRQDVFDQATSAKIEFIQDNESSSSFGVLRGLHFQLPPHAQSKLVRVITGAILDVAVDIRQGSPTFGQHVAVELTEENKHQLFIPRGFAHGFVVLSAQAIVAYKVDNYYAPECDRGLAWNDPDINIDWQIAQQDIKLSDKDMCQSLLADLSDKFQHGVNYYAQ